MELKNQSNYNFSNISSEEWRTYYFPCDNKLSQLKFTEVMISEPVYLAVSESGGHRILDARGVSHYIPKGWVHLSWRAKDGEPHFVK